MGSDPIYWLGLNGRFDSLRSTQLGEEFRFLGVELGLGKNAFANQAMQLFQGGGNLVDAGSWSAGSPPA